jgi:hypothetical protein
MVAIGLVAMYSLLNTGNPDSLLRVVFADPSDDFYVAVISSFIVFVLGFVVFFNRDQEGFHQLIAMNADRIRRQRKKGQSDADIADSILSALGSTSGYRHNMARKKLIIYLAEFK